MTDLERHFGDMQALANSGAAVIGLHDSTGGRGDDVAEFFSDRYGLGASSTIQTLLLVIQDSIKNNKALHLAGHSRGAQKLGLSLLKTEQLLREESPDADAAHILQSLKVETFGGAAPRFPDGPQYIHMDNLFDPVSKIYGLLSSFGLTRKGAHPGRNAVSINLKVANLKLETLLNKGEVDSGIDLIDRAVHNPRSIYFPRRIPFAAAKERGSCTLTD